MKKIVVGVVGNPNCGKTTLFNALTGAHQHVGNWPGVTVEKKTGCLMLGETSCEMVDLPGVYSLGAASRASEDERIARDYVLSGEADLIINIVDASNIERNLYLTIQLLEMGVRLVVAVNMTDIAQRRGIAIDIPKLSAALGCAVVPLVATRKKGLALLNAAILGATADRTTPTLSPTFCASVENAVAELSGAIAALSPQPIGEPRWLGIKLLEGDENAKALEQILPEGMVAEKLSEIEAAAGEEADILIADGRFSLITEIIKSCVSRPRLVSRTMSDRIDRVVLNRALGIPVFLAIMYLMFVFTINVGGAFIDFFDTAGGTLLVDGVAAVLGSFGAPGWLVVVLASGVGGGIQTIGTFVPIIGCLYLFLSFLEDSGYMARAAFVMDRAMRAIGLPGKSFVPLIVGFGCNVPAIMATRTLERRRDRILTVMMAPFMSCGARLPVYALFAAAFFPAGGQNIVFSLYLLGLGFALGTGLLLKHTLLRGETSRFVMELPPYHLPNLGTIVRRTWQRLHDFIFRAGRVIVPMVVVLSFLNAVGPDGSLGHEDSSESILAAGGRALIPAFEPMGMREENWPAAVGVFTGIFAKEAVVGTLNALYGEVARADAAAAPGKTPVLDSTAEADSSMFYMLAAAVSTIPRNLAAAVGNLGDPLGLTVIEAARGADAAAELEVDSAVFGAMARRFDGTAGAYAYLLLILLYMPCVAATGAIYRETGTRWALFSVGWTTSLSYCASVVFYQASVFSRQPVAAAWWIGGCVTFLVVLALVMRVSAAVPNGWKRLAVALQSSES